MKQLNELVHLNGRNDVHNQDLQEPGNGRSSISGSISGSSNTSTAIYPVMDKHPYKFSGISRTND